jgi:hypothetical protein
MLKNLEEEIDKQIKFYKLFQIKQTVIKRIGIKFKKQIEELL